MVVVCVCCTVPTCNALSILDHTHTHSHTHPPNVQCGAPCSATTSTLRAPAVLPVAIMWDPALLTAHGGGESIQVVLANIHQDVAPAAVLPGACS